MPRLADGSTTRRTLLAAPTLLTGPAHAQAPALPWPPRPIRVIVAYPPGGPTDIMGRIAAEALGRDLPQPVIVENRAGASGTIGAEAVARAAPDGTTLLVNASAQVIVPHLQRVPFDALADFAPVTNIADVPFWLVVSNSLPVTSVAELIALLRARPGEFSYASSSTGGASHLGGELFKLLAGVSMTHVPYRGTGQALADLIAGHAPIMFDALPSTAPAVRAGQLRALAVTTAQRQPAFPELPTLQEAGVPGYELSSWYAIWAPARTPAAILNEIQSRIAAGLHRPEAVARLAALGAVPVADSPADFAGFVAREYARFGRLVRDANIRAD